MDECDVSAAVAARERHLAERREAQQPRRVPVQLMGAAVLFGPFPMPASAGTSSEAICSSGMLCHRRSGGRRRSASGVPAAFGCRPRYRL